MSKFVTTRFGRFNRVQDGAEKAWLWECPKCGAFGRMSDAQFEGTVSVVCAGPSGNGQCDYHETHEFGKELVVTMQARVLTGWVPPTDENEGIYAER
jgi:hypothetical protein